MNPANYNALFLLSFLDGGENSFYFQDRALFTLAKSPNWDDGDSKYYGSVSMPMAVYLTQTDTIDAIHPL